MQVDVLHGHHLRVTATGRATFDAEAGAEGGFADAAGGLLADAIEGIRQPDGRGCLALARGRGRDGRDQDQLALGFVLQALVEVQGNLGLGLAVVLDVLGPDAQFLGDALDGQHLGVAGDVDIGGNGRGHWVLLEGGPGIWVDR